MDKLKNLIVISDLHCGCKLGLCPADGVTLAEGGGRYIPSPMMQKIWDYWREFWDEWVPWVTHRQPFGIVVNGDAVDGRHHGSTHQISQNLSDQDEIAYQVLAPLVDRCKGKFWMVKGTEAHVGPSGEQEELLARRLGAIPDSTGAHARYELWKYLGGTRALLHIMHHVGTTGSSAYESTAVYKELVESYVEAGRWGNRPPDCIVRSHRHRHFETKISSAGGRAISVVTPAWQCRTPFTFKVPGGRIAQPMIGGICIRTGKEGHENVYAQEKIWHLTRPPVE